MRRYRASERAAILLITPTEAWTDAVIDDLFRM
jgi:hypothetical protein